MTKTDEELKPCPFCGGAAQLERPGTMRQSMIVVCEECGARVESGDVTGLTAPEFLKWNRRADRLEARGGVEDEEARYLGRVRDDLLTACKDVPVDLPNYADWPVSLPAGHWRDMKHALASLSRGEPEGWREIASETPPTVGFFIGWTGEYAECWNCEVYHQAMSHSGPPNHWTAMKEIARTFTHWMPLPAPPSPEDKG